MLTLPAELTRRYEALLRQQGVAREHQPYYLKPKWVVVSNVNPNNTNPRCRTEASFKATTE